MLEADEIESKLRDLMLLGLNDDLRAEVEEMFSTVRERDQQISCLLDDMLEEVERLLVLMDQLGLEDDASDDDIHEA